MAEPVERSSTPVEHSQEAVRSADEYVAATFCRRLIGCFIAPITDTVVVIIILIITITTYLLFGLFASPKKISRCKVDALVREIVLVRQQRGNLAVHLHDVIRGRANDDHDRLRIKINRIKFKGFTKGYKLT